MGATVAAAVADGWRVADGPGLAVSRGSGLGPAATANCARFGGGGSGSAFTTVAGTVLTETGSVGASLTAATATGRETGASAIRCVAVRGSGGPSSTDRTADTGIVGAGV